MIGKLIDALRGRKHPQQKTQTQHDTTAAKSPAHSDDAEKAAERDKLAKRALAEEIRYTELAIQNSPELFYDYLFGSHDSDKVSELERQILLDINNLLDNPSLVLERVPNLPYVVSTLTGMLDSDDFDSKAFCALVEKDPAIAAQLISVANSAQYNPAGDVISDIRRAFSLLGIQGVKQHVLMSFVKNAFNISQVYYKALGEKIWIHSEDTARVSRDLAKLGGLPADTAFLIGLVHDIGKIMIFKLIVDAFRRSNPDDRLGTSVVKHLLHQKSMQLSILVVKRWNMPEVIVTAIRDLSHSERQSKFSPLGQVLIGANFISEWKLVLGAGLSSEQELEQAMARIPVANDIHRYLAEHPIE